MVKYRLCMCVTWILKKKPRIGFRELPKEDRKCGNFLLELLNGIVFITILCFLLWLVIAQFKTFKLPHILLAKGCITLI